MDPILLVPLAVSIAVAILATCISFGQRLLQVLRLVGEPPPEIIFAPPPPSAQRDRSQAATRAAEQARRQQAGATALALAQRTERVRLWLSQSCADHSRLETALQQLERSAEAAHTAMQGPLEQLDAVILTAQQDSDATWQALADLVQAEEQAEAPSIARLLLMLGLLMLCLAWLAFQLLLP